MFESQLYCLLVFIITDFQSQVPNEILTWDFLDSLIDREPDYTLDILHIYQFHERGYRKGLKYLPIHSKLVLRTKYIKMFHDLFGGDEQTAIDVVKFDSAEFIATDAIIRRMMAKFRTKIQDIIVPRLNYSSDPDEGHALERCWYRLFFDLH
jgi:hypothetical protein